MLERELCYFKLVFKKRNGRGKDLYLLSNSIPLSFPMEIFRSILHAVWKTKQLPREAAKSYKNRLEYNKKENLESYWRDCKFITLSWTVVTYGHLTLTPSISCHPCFQPDQQAEMTCCAWRRLRGKVMWGIGLGDNWVFCWLKLTQKPPQPFLWKFCEKYLTGNHYCSLQSDGFWRRT